MLQGLRRVAVEELGKVEAELQREAREDAALRERHGAAWNRPSSAALNSTLLEKVAGECCGPNFMHAKTVCPGVYLIGFLMGC